MQRRIENENFTSRGFFIFFFKVHLTKDSLSIFMLKHKSKLRRRNARMCILVTMVNGSSRNGRRHKEQQWKICIFFIFLSITTFSLTLFFSLSLNLLQKREIFAFLFNSLVLCCCCGVPSFILFPTISCVSYLSVGVGVTWNIIEKANNETPID